MFLKKMLNLLLLAFLFLLPWQTRLIWHYGELNKGFWEYGTFSLYATEILLWVIIFFFGINLIRDKESRILVINKDFFVAHRTLLFFLSLVLSLVTVVMAASLNWDISYQFIFHFLEALCGFIILVSIIDKKKAMLALWFGGIFQGILAIQQFLTQSIFASKWLGIAEHAGKELGASVIEFGDERWLRAYGSFGSPNSLGIYLAVILIIGMILYLSESRPRIKIILSIGQILILAGLLFSFSRGAILSTFVGFLTLFLIILKKYRENILQFFKQTIFFVIISSLIISIFSPVFFARLNTDNRLEQKSISERGAQYNDALNIFYNSPLLGTGPGTFTLALYRQNNSLQSFQYQPIHNVYFLALVEMGPLVGILLLLFLIKVLQKIVKTNLFYLPVVITLSSAGLFDHWLWSMYTGLVFWWVIWGLGIVDERAALAS